MNSRLTHLDPQVDVLKTQKIGRHVLKEQVVSGASGVSSKKVLSTEIIKMVNCDCCEEKEAIAKFICNCNKKSQYCSSDCKILSARKHKECIPPGSFRPVDKLMIAVYEDCFPIDENTIKQYGFANCTSEIEFQLLFGLYVGLIKFIQLPIDVLHDYCMKDAIAEIIKEKFEAIPEPARGEYYSWFLQHQNIVKNGN